MKFSLIIICLIFSIFSLTKSYSMATVEIVKGKVTQLRPGALQASAVLKGQNLANETSVVTGENSVVRLRFDDGSIMSLGPKSMAIVKKAKVENRDTNVINLLTGRVRTLVNKDPEKRNKFFIKTRSAAMGVRGTDFQTIYSPESKNTALLTFEGEVAMAKVDENLERKKFKKAVENLVVKQNSDGKIEVEATPSKPIVLTGVDAIEEKLKDKDSTSVKAGQFSSTISATENTTAPIKISPVQYKVLKQNFDMITVGKDQQKPMEASEIADINNAPRLADTEVPPEGIINLDKGIVAQKSGGFVDLDTGLYVAPGSESEYDLGRKIFIPKQSGSIDSTTGQYIPPKGVKLDASKGFVPEKGENAQVVAMVNDLNRNISQDVVLGNPYDIKSQTRFERLKTKEMFVKDRLSFDVKTVSQEISVTNSSNAQDKKYASKSGKSYNFLWDLASGTAFQPIMQIGLSQIDFVGNKDSTNPVQSSTNLISIGFGVKYFINTLWTFQVMGATEQAHFVRASGSTQIFEKVALIKGKAMLHGLIWERLRWNFLMDIGGTFNTSKSRGDMEVGMGGSINISPSMRYWFNESYFASLDFDLEYAKRSVSTPNYNADSTRTTTALGIKLGAFF